MLYLQATTAGFNERLFYAKNSKENVFACYLLKGYFPLKIQNRICKLKMHGKGVNKECTEETIFLLLRR